MTGGPRARVLGLLPVLTCAAALAACADSPRADSAPPGSDDQSTVCRSLAQQLPAGSSVQLLVAAGDTIPSGRWPLYRRMVAAVVACAGPDSAITIRPITDASQSAQLFAGAVPARTGLNASNPVRYAMERKRFAADVERALDALPGYGKPEHGTDPLAPLLAAAEDLRAAPAGSKHVVVAVFNGWWQDSFLNLLRWKANPAADAGPIVQKLRKANTLPDLSGTDVLIVGTTASELRVDEAQLVGLCTFWRAVVEAGHGSLKRCAQSLPGIGQDG